MTKIKNQIKKLNDAVHPLRQKIIDASMWMDVADGQIVVVPMKKLKPIIDEHIQDDFNKCDTCYHKKYHEEDVSRRIVKYD